MYNKVMYIKSMQSESKIYLNNKYVVYISISQTIIGHHSEL